MTPLHHWLLLPEGHRGDRNITISLVFFSSRILSSLAHPPSSNPEPGSHTGPSLSLPTTLRAQNFIARILKYFLPSSTRVVNIFFVHPIYFLLTELFFWRSLPAVTHLQGHIAVPLLLPSHSGTWHHFIARRRQHFLPSSTIEWGNVYRGGYGKTPVTAAGPEEGRWKQTRLLRVELERQKWPLKKKKKSCDESPSSFASICR